MTALNGPILFNSSTGSDSLASGLGPSTPVNSTTEGTTASYSGTTITFSGATDLSGVSAGDLLYLATSTGRKFFAIASVNDGADSLTVDDAPTGTASGLSWAIGGKRATLDDTNSRLLLTADWLDEWIVELENAQSISSGINTAGSSGVLTIRGSSLGTPIEQTTDTYCFLQNTSSSSCLVFENILFRNSAGTKTNADAIRGKRQVSCINCTFGETSKTLRYGLTRGADFPGFHAFGCLFHHCVSGLLNENTAGSMSRLVACRFDGCSGAGVELHQADVMLDSCIFANNGGFGFGKATEGGERLRVIQNCIFYNNGDDGLRLALTQNNLLIIRNIFVSNLGYGIDVGTASNITSSLIDFNAFYNNTSGEVNGISNGPNDITLTADPFVDAANGDFNINNTAGGGASLRAATLTMPG